MIKFLDLQKVTAQYATELKQAAADVIDSGWFLQGENVDRFEHEFSSFVGCKHTVTCANGLDALRLIFKAYIELGIMQKGDEVIVPAHTFIATVLAITDNKLKPVFVDADIRTYNLDISKIEQAITGKTKAIVVVHLYGQVCWSKELEYIAQKNNLQIVEDNAQAIGACFMYNHEERRRTGNLGHAAGNSFYPGKNLGALGDCGAVTTNNAELATVVKSLGNYGSKIKYMSDFQGLNSRMDELQAAFLAVKLKYLETENGRRRQVADIYANHIKNLDIVLPFQPDDRLSHVYHIFAVRSKKRDILQTYLTNKGIQTLVHYPIPPHKQACYKEYNHLALPATEQISNEVLSLPMSPVLTEDEIQQVVEAINVFE